MGLCGHCVSGLTATRALRKPRAGPAGQLLLYYYTLHKYTCSLLGWAITTDSKCSLL